MARHHDMAQQADYGAERHAPQDSAMQLPWFQTWDSAAEHGRWAAVHRSEAAQLQAAYDEACGQRPLADVSVSPLVRHGVGGWNTSVGVIVYLSPSAGPAERLLADLECHRAWMMLAPAGGMDDCTLDLPGIQLDARGDREGITVSIAVRDAKLVGELHRRAAHDLEAGARARKPQ